MSAISPKLFVMTPQEQGMWELAINGQAALSHYIFNTVTFKTAVFTVFGYVFIKTLKAYTENGGQNSDYVINRIGKQIVCIACSFMFLYTANSVPFSMVDSKNREWSGTRDHPVTTNGLFWYTLIHKSSTELSRFATKIVGKVFGDDSYLRSPDSIYKLFASMSSVSLDDPQISAKLDALVATCGDTIDGRVMDRSDSLFSLLDGAKSECQQKYDSLKSELVTWMGKNEPFYYVDLMSTDMSDIFNIFRDKEAMDNKIIASAVIAYGKARGNGNPHHLNHEALNLGSSEYFWTSFQKIFTTDGLINLVNFWTGGSTNLQSEMERNNAALVYNRLLNLLPWFRGAIKALIALSFIFASAALAFGALKPMIWWFGILMMEAVYGPASALVYHMSGLFIQFSDLLQKFQSLKFDPMMLIAAHEIDQTLAYLQTVYFVVQMVIIFIFCFGIMQSGWAIQKTNYHPNFGISQGVQKIKQAVTVFTKV